MSEQVKQWYVSNESEEQCLGENSQAERGILKRMGDSTMGNLPHVESDPVADRLSTIVTEVKNGAVEPEKEVCANDLGNRHGSNEDSKDSRSSSDSDSEFSSSKRSSHKKTYRRKEEDHKSRTRKKYSEKDIKKRRKETSEDIRDSRKSAHKKRSFSESDSSERSGSAESSSKRKSYNRERKRSRSRRSPSPKKQQVTSRDSIKSRRTHITRRSEKSPEWSTKHGRHAGETKYRKGTSRKVRAGIISSNNKLPTQEESSCQDKNLTDSICGTEKNPICVSEDSQDNNERVNVKALCGFSDSIMKKSEFPESMRSKNMETLCRTEENSSCINQDFLDNNDKQDVELEELAESMRSNEFDIISCKTEPYSEPTIFDQEMSEPMRDENFNKVFIEGKSLKYEDDRLREDTSQDLNEFQSVASDQGRGPSFAQVYIKQEPEGEIEKTLHESEKNYLKSEPPVFSDICQDNELSVIHQPDISETYGTTAKCQERMGHRSDYFSTDEMESDEVSSFLFSHCDSDLIHTEDTLSDAGSLGSVILFESDETTDGCLLSKRNKKVHFCHSKEGDKISDATLSENQGNQQTHAEESKSNLVNPKTRASFGRTLRNSHSKRTMLEQKDSKKELQDEAFAQANKKGTKKQSDSQKKVSMKRVEKNIITYMASKCPECQAMFVLDKYMSINLKTGDVSLKCQKCIMYTCMMGVLHGEVKNIGSGYEHLPMDSKYRVKLSSKNGENEDSEGRNRQNANNGTKAKAGSLKRKTDNN